MVLRLLVAGSIMLFGLTIEADAGPLGYCDSFARDAANQKTGRADAGAVTIGDSADASVASATDRSLSDSSKRSTRLAAGVLSLDGNISSLVVYRVGAEQEPRQMITRLLLG